MGHSVLLHVTGFLHYLYIAAPVDFKVSDCYGFQMHLENMIGQHHKVIHSVEMVARENLYGFQGNTQSPYLKITLTDHKAINRVRGILESSQRPFTYKQFWGTGVDGGILTFDSIQYVLRFMIDVGIAGMS